MILYRLVRSDGAVIAGPYPAADSFAFKIDAPPPGIHTYTVQAAYAGPTTDTILEIHLAALVIKS